jgi:tRNA uridine 5-carbamoylmethylation protein Kti12
MKHLLVLSGWPGVGKSRWTNRYLLEHHNESVLVISSDDIRRELTGSYNDLSKDRDMWSLYEQRLQTAYESKDDLTIILDSTCLSNSKRIQWVEKYPNFDKKTLVIIKADVDVCRQRNQQRKADKIIPDEAVLKLFHAYQEPCTIVESLYDDIVYIDGNKDE